MSNKLRIGEIDNKPNVLSDYLNQAPKTGKRYEEILNSTEVHDQIIDAFDTYENIDRESCPFPEHKGYLNLWNTLTLEQKLEMRNNIRISSDGKIDIIPMEKKFSMLKAKHNGIDIIDGNTTKTGMAGIPGVQYFTGDAAERICIEQNKNLFDNMQEVERFISFFPGKNLKEKILNFTKLFEIQKYGRWFPVEKNREHMSVNEVSFIILTKVFSVNYGNFESFEVGGVFSHKTYYGDKIDNTNLWRQPKEFLSPVIAYEDY